MRRRRARVEVFSLSFLDAICCGFGAIILLLVLTKIGEPAAIERSRRDLDGLVAKLQEELYEIQGETKILKRKLISRKEQVSQEQKKVARLRGDLSRIQGEFATSKEFSEVKEIVEGRLVAARESLTEEMKRLQAQSHDRGPVTQTVGGIPVDSEYIIFVIDTSGSMQRTWSLVVRKMAQTLQIYPKVKGIQVMNDMGQYMFSRYAGKWIPDSPARRKAILEILKGWSVFSNSSPVEGVAHAIKTYAAQDKKISIYVFGDEFSGDSIDEVVKTIDRINRRDASGRLRVRIHALGFPVIFSLAGVPTYTGVRFATLMRILCERNDGTFVGLNHIQR
ncbi:MAG: VWA domain-containing protein [Acidobacteriota bacterium]